MSQDAEGQKGSLKEEYDACVRCGNLTEYLKETPIDLRKYYVEGAGQTCKDCHKSVYGD